MDSNTAEPSPHAMRQSCIAFSIFLLLVILGISFPEVPSQGLHGVLWVGVGMLMVFLPPVVRIPKLWTLLAFGFIGFSLVGFLPRECFSVTPWRIEVEKLGTQTGSTAFVQPMVAIEYMVKFAITAITALYLLGHRIHSRCQQWISLGFSVAVACWIIMGLLLQKEGQNFGFFPNRNHTATLLSMAVFVSVGGLAQAVRHRKFTYVAVLAPCILLPLWVLFTLSISRSGIVLVGLGGVLWLLLAGRNNLRGNAGKALALIALAALGAFLMVDSTAKKRLTETTEDLSLSSLHTSAAYPPGALVADGRWPIIKDTWNMIRSEAWTGVGPGQFAYVYPQYRESSNRFSIETHLHPESDWFMMLAEVGWLPFACLVLGILIVVGISAVNVRKGKGRLLRTGCLVGAMLLLAHGIIDVPGHRIGIAWAGILLLAASLQGLVQPDVSTLRPVSTFNKNSWRALGFIVVSTGGFLVACEALGKVILPVPRVEKLMAEAAELFRKDQVAFNSATEQGKIYNPPPAECPLEAAIHLTNEALAVIPLDPFVLNTRGKMALYLDDMDSVALKDFETQQLLDPANVSLYVNQAFAWAPFNRQQMVASWSKAMKLALLIDQRTQGKYSSAITVYSHIIEAAYKVQEYENIFSDVLELANKDHAIQMNWAMKVPTASIDREMPQLLSMEITPEHRNELFQAWLKRGTKPLVLEYAKNHPEMKWEIPE